MCTETPLATDEREQEMAPTHTLSKKDLTVVLAETLMATDEREQEIDPPHALSKEDPIVVCAETPMVSNLFMHI